MKRPRSSASFSPMKDTTRGQTRTKKSAYPPTIDSIDVEILSLLQQNGKASTSEIAKKIGSISKVAVSYRIRRLIERKIIQGFHAKINPDLVGRGYPIITRVNCRYKGPKEDSVCAKIAAMPEVQSIYQIFGPYDILVIARCDTKESAKQFIRKLYDIPGIRSTNTVVPHTIVKESLDVNLQPFRR